MNLTIYFIDPIHVVNHRYLSTLIRCIFCFISVFHSRFWVCVRFFLPLLFKHSTCCSPLELFDPLARYHQVLDWLIPQKESYVWFVTKECFFLFASNDTKAIYIEYNILNAEWGYDHINSMIMNSFKKSFVFFFHFFFILCLSIFPPQFWSRHHSIEWCEF